MKINFKLETPKFVQEARESQKGWHWIVELLVFVLMFFICSIGEGLLITPIQLVMMFTDPEYIQAITTQDPELMMQVTNKLLNSNGLVIGMLFVTIAMTLLTMLFCKVIQKRKMTSLGFVKKGMFKEYGFGLLSGFLFFSVSVLLCVLTGSLKLQISGNFVFGTWILFGLGYMLQGMAEEVFCRSYLMVSIARRYPIWVAVLVNALFFAALHLGNSGISFLAIINLSLFGIFASIYFIKRGNIWGIGAFHSIWNFVQGNFYGIKVSGMSSSCSVFTSNISDGMDLIHGGAFGLEGGLAVTLALTAGILFLLTKPAKNSIIEE